MTKSQQIQSDTLSFEDLIIEFDSFEGFLSLNPKDENILDQFEILRNNYTKFISSDTKKENLRIIRARIINIQTITSSCSELVQQEINDIINRRKHIMQYIDNYYVENK